MDRAGFHVRQRRHADRLAIQVRGEVDVLTAPRLDKALLAACQPPVSEVVVDFTEVGFFDTQALDVLAAAAGRLRSSNCRLVVHGLSAWQEKVVRMFGLEEALSVDHGHGHDEPTPPPTSRGPSRLPVEPKFRPASDALRRCRDTRPA